MPTAVTRPDKPGGAGRKRLSDLHGSVTMRDVGGEAEKRRLEDEAQQKAVQERKRVAAEKKDEAARAAAGGGSCSVRALRARLRVRCGAVPVRQVEALFELWAQEQHVQDTGVRGRTQAAPAGLQPGRGGAAGGFAVARVDARVSGLSTVPVREIARDITWHGGDYWRFWVYWGEL